MLDRRQMLAAGAAAVPLAANAADKAVKNGRVKQSVCAWCFTGRGEKWSLDKTCATAAGLGVPSVELVGAGDFPTLAKHNLACAITSTGLGFPRGFNNPRHRDELVGKTKAAIDATAAAKFPSVIGFVGMRWVNPDDPKSGEIARDEAFKNCVEGIKLVAGHAERAGVTLCIEHLNSRDGSDPMRGHPGYQGDDLDWVVEILKAVGSPRVKLLFDVYHVQIMHGDLIRRIEVCKEWIGHVHTAGNPGRGELDDAQEINYPAVMRKLVQVGYGGFVGQEFIPTRDPLAKPMTHSINLSARWDVSAVEPGRVRFARRFGRPPLSPGETAWLVGDAGPGPGSLTVNGEVLTMLSAGEPFAVDVTSVLRERNEAWLDVRAATDAPLGRVAMEIRQK